MKSTPPWTAATITAAALALVLAGCSSDDGSRGSTEAAPSAPTARASVETPTTPPTPTPTPTSAPVAIRLEVPADSDWAEDYDDGDAEGACRAATRFARDVKDKAVATLMGVDGKSIGKVRAQLSESVDTDPDDNDLCVFEIAGLDVPLDGAPYRLRIGAFTSDPITVGNLSSMIFFDDDTRSATDKAFLKYVKKHIDVEDYDLSDALTYGPEECAELESGYKAGSLDAVDELADDLTSEPAVVRGAVKYYCPKYADTLSVAERTFSDGDYVVGADIKAGTYRTAKRATDCYWERSTSGGSIIRNDFVSFAAQGVTVTINKGEGFTSDNCGNWYPVG